MAEAYIVSYIDYIDADIENIISYPRNSINPIMRIYMRVKTIRDNYCKIKMGINI